MIEDKVVHFDKDSASKLSQMVKEEGSFFRTKNGAIKPKSLYNIEWILEHDPELVGMFKFNEFTGEIDVVRTSDKLIVNKGMLKDSYIDELASYIESSKSYEQTLFANQLIRSALTVVANRNRYNPVLEYMNIAYRDWDKEERLDTFFSDYLGVDKSAVTRLITRLFFVGAVAKVYNPSRKFDFVLDLVGGQGAGKTTILQKIAPCGYYTDQFSSFENKDDFAVMRRALIVNDDEMTATANSTFEVLKKFVTLQEFEYRKPYGHQAERFPKGFVLARTTNNLYYLKDKTGERRFLPLLVDKDRQLANPVKDLTPEYVKQAWGEAVHIFKSGDYSFDLTSEQQEMLDEHRQTFMYTDDLEDAIADALDNDWADKDFLSSETIGLKVVPGADLARNRKLSNQIANIMINRFGWRKGRKKVNGKTQRGYIKGDTSK